MSDKLVKKTEDNIINIGHTNYHGSNQIAKIVDDVVYSSVSMVASVANSTRLTLTVIHSNINQYEIDRIQIESSFKTEKHRIEVEAGIEKIKNVCNLYANELKRIEGVELPEESKKYLYDLVKAKMKEELDKLT